MLPGFKSRRRRHMWVEFVVDSLLCSERFFAGYSGFPLYSKTNILKFQFDQESDGRRTTMWMCYLQIVILFYLAREGRLALDPTGLSPFLPLWNLHKVELFSAFLSLLDDISSASQFERKKLTWKTVGFETTTQKTQYMYTTLTSKTTEVLKCPKGLRSMGSNDNHGDITSDSMLAITNPESHAHPSFVNVFTMLLYMANAVNILSVALPHVHNSVNC